MLLLRLILNYHNFIHVNRLYFIIFTYITLYKIDLKKPVLGVLIKLIIIITMFDTFV